MQIRLATPDDISQLVELGRASDTAAHWTPRQYRDLFEAKRPLLVLIGGAGSGTILGFLVARHVAGEWELENIVVSGNERRKGIATKLISSLVKAAREAQGRSILLEVRESNHAARGLYEHVGFQQTGRRKQYYAAPAEDAVLYRMDLE
ncbi:MAG TPA: ribosomal protein S18-alanine N-acetyltransferase [Candidatus Sulfotelmatobacter sp.]|nr:ribosomal protein S18-alanine N-acetyltransferase [Candidatus Sulfotelmatobacter sp.]